MSMDGSVNMSDRNRFDIEVECALSDISVLLDYLGKQPNAKLQSCFQISSKPPDGTSVAITPSGATSSPGGITPPANTYFEFLNRISLIQSKFADTGNIREGDNQDKNQLTNVAFVLWTRDFLSALAAPATAGSIRITNAYMEQRFTKSKNGFDQYKLCAKKTVSTVKWMQNMGIGAILFSVVISIYALSGHQILGAKLSAMSALKQINEKIELAQRQDTSQPIVNPALIAYLKSIAPTENEDHLNKVGTSINKENGRLTGKFSFCDNIDVTNFSSPIKSDKTLDRSTDEIIDIGMPSNGPASSGRYYYYGSLDEITLCNERKAVLRQLLAISDELISWQRTVTNPLPAHVSPPPRGDLPEAMRDQGGGLTQVASIDADRDLMKDAASYVLSMPGSFLGHFVGGGAW